MVKIKNIDEATEKEVLQAIQEKMGNFSLQNDQVMFLKSYGDIQTAVVSLPERKIKELLEKGRLKID